MFFIRHRDIQCMNLDINFLAVIDDNYFMNNAFFYASKIENYADIIWYRIKNKDNNYEENIKKMRSVVKKCPLVLSCDYLSALKHGYDGVHLNKSCLENLDYIKEKGLITGYSSHSANELELINTDYYTLSPIYDTPKDYKVKPLGIIDYNKNKKVYALGGINLENMQETANHFYGVAGIRLVEEIVNKLVFNT